MLVSPYSLLLHYYYLMEVADEFRGHQKRSRGEKEVIECVKRLEEREKSCMLH